MKKLLFFIMSVLNFSFTTKIFIKLTSVCCFLSCEKTIAQLPAGSMSAGPSTIDSSYTFFRFNTPTNNPGNRWEPLKVGIREIHLRTNRIFIDSLSQHPLSTMPSTANVLWFDNRELKCSLVTGITLSYSQVTASIGYVPLQMEVDGSITNEIQIPAISGQTLSLSGTTVTAIIPTQTTVLTSSQVTTALGYIPLQTEIDGSISNEIQSLSISGQTISLSGSNSIIVPTQTVSTLITGTNAVTVTGSYPNFTISAPSQTVQPLTSSQVTTALGYIPLQTEVDGSISNEIQTLSLSGQSISISGGNTITIPTQTTVLTSGQVTTALGYLPLQTEVDGSITNEIQSLSLSGQSISISSGNTIVIPTQTVVLTSGQVTTALGFVPATNTVISNVTVAIVPLTGSGFSVTSSYPNFTLTPYSPTTNTVTRPINSTTFQPSSSQPSWVYYTIRISCSATIGGSSAATITLQYSNDSGSTWIDVGQLENSNTITLAIALNSTTIQTAQLSGYIPKNVICRMNQTTSGTTTITYVKGQETN